MMMKTVKFSNGTTVPALGQGTWGMGEGHNSIDAEADCLKKGLDLGLTLIDTAEMYANGGAEKVVGVALQQNRDRAFVVSKVLPSHASANGTMEACERSLKNLKTDVIDLYLLHWPSSYPLEDTVMAFEQLMKQGKIKAWGVSNFDVADMTELENLAPQGHITVNQILYNLSRRGTEFDLLPWCQKRNIALMAYSPIEQGRILKNAELQDLAKSVGLSVVVLALAWVIRQPQMIAIPKASSIEHIKENYKALDLKLDPDILKKLDAIFTPPTRKMPLEVI